MAKKTQYAFLFAFGILLYFLLYQSQIVFKNTIPLLIILGAGLYLSLIHISEPTRRLMASRMPSSA